MGEHRKLTLSELKDIGNIETERRNNQYIIYITEVTDLTSHIFKQLLYRLENVKGKTLILLGESGKVFKKDIEAGIFVDKDRGKDKCKVLSERYSVGFRTPIVTKQKQIEDHHLSLVKTNLIIIDGKGSTYTEKRVIEMQERTKRNQTLEIFIIEAFYNGKDIHVRNKVINKGKLRGSGDEIIERNQGVSLHELYVLNSMASQFVFNIVNAIVTEGMSYNYGKITGDLKQAKLVKDYVRKEDKDSVFQKIVVPGYFTLTREAKEFDEKYQEYKRGKKLKIRKEVMDIVDRGESHIFESYVNLVKYKAKNMYKGMEEGKEKEVVMKILGYVSGSVSGGSLGGLEETMALVSYVESKTTGLF